ncbi:MAG: hypothetical protein AAGG56_14665 [Pseudomonadota bacterium]
MSTETTNVSIERLGRSLPDLRPATWFLRVMLAAIILDQGFSKVPLSAADAASFGVPLILWGMAAMGEILAGVFLIAGGLIRNGIGGLVTRLGGLLLAMIVASVLVVVYWAPPVILFYSNQLQLMLLVGGLYFLFRGNAA